MTKLASNQRARSKRIASHKRTRSSRLHRLQFERFESRVVFDGDGMQAINDVYTTETNTPLEVAVAGVLENDLAGENNSAASMQSEVYREPRHGSLQLSQDGSFVYTPNEGFAGVDSFLYRARSGESISNLAAVTIRVTAGNQGPQASDDSYTLNEDGSLDVGSSSGVLHNDTDSDGDPLEVSLKTGPSNGSLVLNANGSFRYVPNAQFHGADRFVYSVSDGSTSDEAEVTIEVASVNDSPVAANDAYSVDEDTELSIATSGILSNDTDIDGDSLVAEIDVGPEHGELTLEADGKFVYRPNANFHGTDAFSYRASDGSATSDVVVVEILVRSINDAPLANNDSFTMDEDGFLEVTSNGLLSNDSDAESDPLTVQLDAEPEHGVLTLSENGSFTYRPNENFHGTDAFSYRVFDGVAFSEIAVVEIVVQSVNDLPVASNDHYQTGEDETLTIAARGVLANDNDGDQDPLTAVLDVGPEHGSLTLNSDGSFTYVPDANYNGTDAFSYRATDGTDFSEVIAVQIDVTAINDAPVGVNDSYATDKGVRLVIAAPGVLANDTDVEGDTLSAILETGPARGQLTLNSDGSFEYLPEANFRGMDSFTYRTSDGNATSPLNTVFIKVGGDNTRPIAVNDSFVASPGSTLIISPSSSILRNDTDAEGDLLTPQVYRTTRNGQLSLQNDGSFSYTPNAGFVGTDSFLYRVNDGELNSLLAAVTIHVRPAATVNASPTESRLRLQSARTDLALSHLAGEWNAPMMDTL